jgi:hypothetical protein
VAILPRSMSDAPDGESPQTRSHGRRFVVLATAAGLLLLVGGFFIGRVSEGESSETPATTTEPGDTRPGDDAPRINTRACGKGAGPDAEDVVKVFPPTIVTDAAIEEQEKDSPGRALLEWWQAYQFGDLPAVEALTSQATIDTIGEDNLQQLVQLPGPGLQGIEILDASESGNTASVNAGLLNFQPGEPGQPPPREPSNSAPETLPMEKDGGDWLFAGSEFLTLRLNSLPE